MKENLMIVRKTPVILAVKFVWLEVLMVLAYGLSSSLVDGFLGINLVRLGIFLLLTSVEIALVFWLALKWMGEQYLIGGEELIHRRGVMQISEESFSLKNVQAVSMTQSFLGRLFDFGTVKFFSPVLKQEYILADIPSPMAVKMAIERSTGGFSTKSSMANDGVLIPIRNTK